MHRWILSSTAFQQTSLANSRGLEIDPRNHQLWRYPLRRLDAEAIRDSQLAISGQLDQQFDGPYTPTVRNGAAEVIVPEDQPNAFRRSIYLQQRRSQTLSLLSVFDAPAMVINCTRRPVTTMPLQSLSLLNSAFSVERGRQLSRRIARELGIDSANRHEGSKNNVAGIDYAFQLVTGRGATPEQITDAEQFLATQQQQYVHAGADNADAWQHAWSDLCQMLLSSSAFLYLE